MPLLKTALKAAVVTLVFFGLLYGSFKLWVNGVATVSDKTGDVISVAANYGDYSAPFSYWGLGLWVRFGIAADASAQLRCRDGLMAETGYLVHTGHTHIDIDQTCKDMP